MLSVLFSLFIMSPLKAQDAREEIKNNVCLSASNYLAYPGPSQKKLTPAPKGYHPFYISHYGRHGSRYLIDSGDYDVPAQVLARADSLGKLTPLGKDVLRRVQMLRSEAAGRLGELTELGAEQHKQIARRMYECFPEVFSGNVVVDAKSTVVIRCILSMENEMQQLLLLNPKLRIKHDASMHDMYYMNQSDPALYAQKMPRRADVAWKEYCARRVNPQRLMLSLFNDSDYVKYEVDAADLNYKLFSLASNLQSSELRHKITLYDIFTNDELYANWQLENSWWYINYGPSPLNGGTQPFSQRNLLRNIIHQADSCIALERPGATLRFGHETMVLPLTCLLGINGYDRQIASLDSLESNGWINYKVFPMAANIQLIFYRRSPKDTDVLVKVLLNENEAALPVNTDCAPYYHWNDFKEYYLNKLKGYKE